MHSDKSRKRKAPSPIENEEGRKKVSPLGIRVSCQMETTQKETERKSGNEQEEGKNGRKKRVKFITLEWKRERGK